MRARDIIPTFPIWILLAAAMYFLKSWLETRTDVFLAAEYGVYSPIMSLPLMVALLALLMILPSVFMWNWLLIKVGWK